MEQSMELLCIHLGERADVESRRSLDETAFHAPRLLPGTSSMSSAGDYHRPSYESMEHTSSEDGTQRRRSMNIPLGSSTTLPMSMPAPRAIPIPSPTARLFGHSANGHYSNTPSIFESSVPPEFRASQTNTSFASAPLLNRCSTSPRASSTAIIGFGTESSDASGGPTAQAMSMLTQGSNASLSLGPARGTSPASLVAGVPDLLTERRLTPKGLLSLQQQQLVSQDALLRKSFRRSMDAEHLAPPLRTASWRQDEWIP